MPFRFIHTADLHLDSPLRSLALKNADLAALVRGSTRFALSNIVDLCISERVDVLLIAGDLYDGGQTSMNTALFLTAELRRLDEAGIRVCLIRGNHDAQSTMTRELTFSANVHLFSTRSRSLCLKRLGDGREVHVHGVGFANPHASDSLLPHFASPVPDAVNIGMLHTSLAGAPGHDRYAPASVADLAAHGFDYWALGHVHQRQIHAERPLIVMPGMPQGRDINEAGPKSVTLVTVDDNGTFTHEERRIGQTVFQRLTIDLAGIEDWRDMLDHIREGLSGARVALAQGHLILRLLLTGITPLAWKLRRDPEFLLADVTATASGLADCWIEAIDVQCDGIDAIRTSAGPDPVHELAGLIRGELLASHFFQQAARDIARDLLDQLPRELREAMAGDEVALEALVAEVSRSGSDDFLAHLAGGEPARGATA